jgi:hypothetical protein
MPQDRRALEGLQEILETARLIPFSTVQRAWDIAGSALCLWRIQIINHGWSSLLRAIHCETEEHHAAGEVACMMQRMQTPSSGFLAL